MELLPAGAPKDLTSAKAKTLLATVRPRDIAGRTRRQLATDLIDDISALDRKVKDPGKRLAEAVAATGTSLTRIVGIGPVTVALILDETGDVRRFATKHHYAAYTGTAPREVSSGDIVRHRLSRAGNRQLNHALHIAALANKRFDDRGRDYYARKVAAGKGSKGAMRCTEATLVRRRLPRPARGPAGRSASSSGGGPGRTLGGVYKVQRGCPIPDGQHFGSVTCRTRHCGRYAETSPGNKPLLTQRGAVLSRHE
jgi:transposase